MKVRARIAGPALALGFVLPAAACGAGAAEHSTSSSEPALSATASNTATRSVSGTTSAARAAGGVRLQLIGNFEQPLYLTAAPGDRSRVYVVERTGQVMLLLNGRTQATPFLDVGSSIATTFDEQGLLGLAFPADYAKSGLFYVDFTSTRGDIEIVQYHRSASNPNVADPASAHTLLTIGHQTNDNHNGGQLAFGPEGDLYIGVGDGGSEDDPEGNGQNTDTLLGKILRIARRRAAATRFPAATRSSASATGAPRSGRTGFVTRGASRSIARPVTCSSATSARISRRRSTSPRPAAAPARTTAGASGRATVATSPDGRRTPSSRCSSPVTATATARSSAATSCAIVRCRASTAATCSATTAGRRSSRSPFRTAAPALRRRRAFGSTQRPRSAGRRRACLRDLARRAGLPDRAVRLASPRAAHSR